MATQYSYADIQRMKAQGYNTVEEYIAAQDKTGPTPSATPTRGQQEIQRGNAAANDIRAAGDRAAAGVNRLTGNPAGSRQLYGGKLAPPGQGQGYYRDANGAYFVADRPAPAPMVGGERRKGGSSAAVAGGSRGTGRVGAARIGGGTAAGGASVGIVGPDNNQPHPAWIGGPAEVNPEEIRGVNENAQFFASKKGVATERDAAFAAKFPGSVGAARMGPEAGNRPGHILYGPGTLGSPTGVDYYGPQRPDGSAGSATSGNWTVRAHDDGTRTPLAPNAYARRFGHTTEEGLSAGLGAAAFVDVLKQKIPEGESGVNAYADRGGAEMEKSINRLMHSQPGEKTEFPTVYRSDNPKDSPKISNASTYNPRENELFQPSIISAQWTREADKLLPEGKTRDDFVVGKNNKGQPLYDMTHTMFNRGNPDYHPAVDPLYAAQILRNAGMEDKAAAWDQQGQKLAASGGKYNVVNTETMALTPWNAQQVTRVYPTVGDTKLNVARGAVSPPPPPPTPPPKKKDEEE